MKHYLIDFDNVNTKKDLKAWSTFTEDYCIYLFYTPEKSKVDAKTQLNADIQKALAAAKYKQKKIQEITAIVMEHYGTSKFSSVVHDELGKHYTDFRDIYDVIKPVLNGKRVSTDVKAQVRPSEEIRMALKKAKMDADTINYVGNLIDSHYGQNGWKQIIYRAIIKKYGQNEGLELYNQIKKQLK